MGGEWEDDDFVVEIEGYEHRQASEMPIPVSDWYGLSDSGALPESVSLLHDGRIVSGLRWIDENGRVSVADTMIGLNDELKLDFHQIADMVERLLLAE